MVSTYLNTELLFHIHKVENFLIMLVDLYLLLHLNTKDKSEILHNVVDLTIFQKHKQVNLYLLMILLKVNSIQFKSEYKKILSFIHSILFHQHIIIHLNCNQLSNSFLVRNDTKELIFKVLVQLKKVKMELFYLMQLSNDYYFVRILINQIYY